MVVMNEILEHRFKGRQKKVLPKALEGDEPQQLVRTRGKRGGSESSGKFRTEVRLWNVRKFGAIDVKDREKTVRLQGKWS